MNFGSLEKMETVILRPSKNFTIKNVVIFGSRNKIGVREDSFKEFSYKSNKYSNMDYVGGNTLETQDFLVFSFYSNINDKWKQEEIFISYPHIYELKEFLERVYNEYSNNEVFEYNSKGIPYVTKEYEEYLETIELINNRSIGLMFDVIEKHDENIGTTEYKEGITFVFNNDNLTSTVDTDTFYYICKFIEDFNLLQSSQNLILLSFMNEIAKSFNLENKVVKSATTGKVNRKIKGRREIEEDKKANIDRVNEYMKALDDDPREEIPFDEVPPM